jgi:hypothetical protein
VTAPVDYKIKSFGKRVVRDKSFLLSVWALKARGKVVFRQRGSSLRAIHQLVIPSGAVEESHKNQKVFLLFLGSGRVHRLKDKSDLTSLLQRWPLQTAEKEKSLLNIFTTL